MRILIDLQGAQTESRLRGIGRYSLSFAQAIARNRADHEVVILLSAYHLDTIDSIREEFRGLVPDRDVCVWHGPGPVNVSGSGNTWRRAASELIREEYIARLEPDIVHVSSIFEGHVDDAVCSIGRHARGTPVSVSVYDLIPLLNPEKYLDGSLAYRHHYQTRLDDLGRADLLLAISEHTRSEVVGALQVAADRVVNVSTAAERHFRPQEIEPAERFELLSSLGIERSFVLHAGGADDRKNLARLIESFARLEPDLRRRHQLVLAGRIPDGHLRRLKAAAKAAGLRKDEVVYVGQVNDDELVGLYNLCAVFVMPSWHEGFGLPALEAMCCGAPTIGANVTSLPEVIQNEAALFDPFDVQKMSQMLSRVLSDDVFRSNLRESGLVNSAAFSWDRSAGAAIAAFERTVAGRGGAARRQTGFCQEVVSRIPDLVCNDQPTDADLAQVARCVDASSKGLLAFRRRHGGLTWQLEGPFDSAYSLAVLNRETALAMTELGLEVSLYSTEGPGDFEPDVQFLQANPALAKLHRKTLDRTAASRDVVSRNLYPPRVYDMGGDLSTLHHYAWEETGFPAAWVDEFNGSLDGITCLSRHVRKVLLDNGVSVPMTVSGCGVDHWERIEPSPDYQLKARKFRFLHVSSCFPRKGVDCLLDAYGQAFTAEDDVSLVIKTFHNPHNDAQRLLDSARLRSANFPHVVVIHEELNESDLKALVEECDVLVAPSKAEGYGLPMAEAMLSGLPVITTNWSGQLDFCDVTNSWLVDYDFERADTHFGISLSAWAKPNVAALAEAMRKAQSTGPESRRRMAQRGREHLLEHHRWTDVSQRYVDAVSGFIDELSAPIPRVAWLSTWKTKCGIAAYSEHLLATWSPDHFHVFAPVVPSGRGRSDRNCTRLWNQGKYRNGLSELHQALDELSLNTVVIQFNYGFFNHEELSDFVLTCRRMGRQVILILHSTADPADMAPAQNYSLSSLRDALGACSRVLVHSVNDLNRLKSLGLVENVALFPHGVIPFAGGELATELNRNRPLVASYGYCLPHKGLPELIRAVALLRDRGEDVDLRLVNAEFPTPHSAALIDELEALVSRLNLSDRVWLNHEFLPDEQSLQLLAESDLVVFPYQETGESSSAAVRHGLASRRPVAVAPLPIFDDTRGATFRFEGTSVDALASGISRFLSEIRNDNHEAVRVKEAADKWRREFDYGVASSRLWGMCVGLLRYQDTLSF